ncbi:rhodanese-like domain-containing protein, partial [Buchnera aphidicola]|nr:rhodanese-like domain-containing protein [Buchnera aphidicola]
DFFYRVNIISIFQAIQLINEKKAIVLDTRSIRIFEKGHIVNSINISLCNIFNGNIKKLDLYQFDPIIIISKEPENLYKY